MIPNFVDVAAYAGSPVQAGAGPGLKRPGERVLLHLSNFRPVKRVMDVVRIFERVAAVVPEAVLWMVGEGPERDQLVGDARALRRKVDSAALPILLPALSLGRPLGPLRRPLAYWWAARRGRY